MLAKRNELSSCVTYSDPAALSLKVLYLFPDLLGLLNERSLKCVQFRYPLFKHLELSDSSVFVRF